MLEMRGINKRFDAVIATNKASLKVSSGEIRALLGSNGSGKSTMIKILAGVYAPDGGEILMDGQPVSILSGLDSKNLGIATAFQEKSLIPTMSVVDNLILGNEPRGSYGVVDRKKAREQIKIFLERFSIDCELDAYVQSLMPSTQAMLEIAKAVQQKPRLLLLDEVTASLHYDEIKVLFKIIRELKVEGVAILFVTHRMNEVFELCDHVTIMRGGETVMDSPTDELTLDDIVYYMTGQKPEISDAKSPEEAFAADKELLLNVREHEVYPKVWDISMKVYSGEIIGIAGLQGQGQSEFIRSLLGAQEVTGGTVEFCGENVKFRSPAEAVRHGVGFISGDRGREAIFPVRSIYENISAGKIAKGNIAAYLSPKSLLTFSRSSVDAFNIKTGALRDPANTLSGGNQQKLVIARWVAMNPILLLLDDPTKGVDVHSRRDIHKTLKQCAADGMTVIISSSENEELLDISDRIYVFYEGYLSDMLVGENKTEERLVAAMLGMAQNEKDGGGAQ